MKDFPKKYKFQDYQLLLGDFWNECNIYCWNKKESRDTTYVIDTPPPSISGSLHMGHIYSYTHTDFIARYQRMKGMNIFYPMGFDDNGLPTERLVEKKKKIRAKNMSREDFIAICKDVIKPEEDKIKNLFNKIGLSVDWQTQYSTISDHSCYISQMSFLDLMQKNQIYRSDQPMLWDPIDQTALSQADIEEHEKTTWMNDIEFITENKQKIIIATTRPELLPACVSVFFHPDDVRYNNLHKQFAISPLFNVRVPLIADDMVDPEKGTGLVMCCTFGDQTDVVWWRKHKLSTKIIFTKWGTISDTDFDNDCLDEVTAKSNLSKIVGLKILDARQKILELLREENLLLKQTEKTQSVKCAERSGGPLEILITPQWFVKAIEHKESLLDHSKTLNWHPSSMKIKLDQWIKGVSLDWCISRQRYFGVPFPVWYSKRKGEVGKIIFAKSHELPVNPIIDTPEGYSKDEVEPDYDVMDTWSTSSVSPQINSHGIANDFMIDQERHNKLFPADLRPQAHEILRSWAFYTMLKSHIHENTLPWNNIMVSGWCLAKDKSKMSKSKGNILDPEMLLKTHGPDALRYWAASATLGSDTAYSEDAVKNGQRLINKLWNASKFVMQHFDKIPDDMKCTNIKQHSDWHNDIKYDYDKYFLHTLYQLIDAVSQELEIYEYSRAIAKIEQFFWSNFCDNYLEITKTRAYGENIQNDQAVLSARLTLFYSLQVILKLFAPFLPYATEVIYNHLYCKQLFSDDDNSSIHARNMWPKSSSDFSNDEHAESKNLLIILDLVRKSKAQKNLSIKAPIKSIEIIGAKLTDSLIDDLTHVISAQTVTQIENIDTQQSKVDIDNNYQRLSYEHIQINIVYDV